ncbi:MAG: MobF family relaxase, partial [Gammaproteobacteria bacterium]
APPPGRVEEYASWRASWRALGRPEDVRAESELSDGALRLRVRAYQREKAWAPPYVAKTLAGTNQAAQAARDDAVVLTSRAQAATDIADRAEFERQATEAAGRATVLEQRAAQLSMTDTQRATWWVRTAVTRDLAERARSELASRGIDPDRVEDPVTVTEWFAAHRAEQAESEPHRIATDADIDTTAEDRDAVLDGADSEFTAETNVPDIREIASIEPPTFENLDDWERVADVHETRDALDRARRALLEDDARRGWEAQREQEDRSLRSPQWQAADQARADADARDHEPVLEC